MGAPAIPPSAPYRNLKKNPGAAICLLPRSGFATQAADATNGVLMNRQFMAMAPFFGARIQFENHDSVNPMVIDAVYVAVAAVSLTPSNSALTWVQVFIDGAAGFIVPPAKNGANSKRMPGVVSVDTGYIASIARTDTPGAPPILRVAAHLAPSSIASVHNGYNSTQLGIFNSISANPGFIEGMYMEGNIANVQTAARNCIVGGNANPMTCEFFYNTPIASYAEFGDSRSQGAGTGGGVVWYDGPADYMLWQSYGTAKPVATRNHGTAGMKSIDILTNAKMTLAQGNILPQFAGMTVWSPNDGNTQAIYDASWGYALEFVEFCKSIGITPCLSTCYPSSGSTWALIDANNAKARALCAASNGTIILMDRGAALNNPSSPGTIIPAYDSGDGVHANAAGVALEAIISLAALPR